MTTLMIADFSSSNTADWRIVNDAVMGGESKGKITTTEEGHAAFYGVISLENNGGFSMVKHNFDTKDIADYSKVKLKVKGDGKRYQFRVKTDKADRHSYVHYFTAPKEWQIIEIPLSSLAPQWRGEKLRMPNYPSEKLEEVAFLFGNKKEETFELLIDSIWLD